MLGRVLAAAGLGNDMRGQDPGFAAHVALYEARHGALTAAALAVATQANYLCWFEAGFPRSLQRVCAAIGSGQPARLCLCQQVSPERWLELHHYVVAAQCWLGDDRRLPAALDADRVDYISALLGPPTPARRALTEVYLATLIDQLLYSTSLSVLGAESDGAPDEYADFSTWYHRASKRVAPDCHLYRVSGGDGLVKALTETATAALGSESDVGGDLPARLLENASRCQPPCMHRFTRYLDVRAASIGALKWRAGLPPDPHSRQYWAEVFADASAAVDGWLMGAKPATTLANGIHAALGERDSAKTDMVELFLKEPPASDAFWKWMGAGAVSAGAMSWQLFGLPAPAGDAA